MELRHGPSFLPLIAFLAVMLIAFYPALRQLPPIEELFHVTPRARVAKPAIKVWVNKRSGVYYCSQTESYGKVKPGFYASEQEAVRSGYRPAGREACR